MFLFLPSLPLVPPSFRTAFNAVTVKKGEDVILNCNPHGEKAMTITWSKDRMPFDPAIDPRYELRYEDSSTGMTVSLKIKAADRRDSCLLTCIASNNFGRAEYNLQVIVQGKLQSFNISSPESNDHSLTKNLLV